MANIIKILRSPTAGNRPPVGTTAGEPYVNFADGQFGVWDAGAVDLIAVRFWNSAANYVVGDHVVSGGGLYVANAPNTNTAPPGGPWNAIGAGGVTTFNTRTGAVVLTLGDVTTAFPAGLTPPVMDGAAAVGVANAWSRADHVHPSDTSRLPLAGGTMTGAITIPAAPAAGTDAVNKNYVDNAVGNLQLFLGVWDVAGNTPDITAGGTNSGDYYIAVTANPNVPETAPGGIPGIGGSDVGNGDLVLWNGTIWETVKGSGLTLAEADQLYVQLGGGTMTGALILDADPTNALGAATKQYVDDAIIDAGTF
jgi:hypothetical protein